MVSIIIAAYNEEKYISALLESIYNLKAMNRYEIIVVDDGSTDSTRDIVSSFPGVRLLTQRNQGPGAARNTGAQGAQGDILVFIDADTEVIEHWLDELVRPFEDQTIVGVKGFVKSRQKAVVSRFVDLDYGIKHDKLLQYPEIDFINTGLAAYRRSVFLEMGGFDTGFRVGEDIDLSYRISRNKNYRMVAAPRSQIWHMHEETLKEFIKKKVRNGYWRILVYDKNPEKTRNDTHTTSDVKYQTMALGILFVWAVLYLANISVIYILIIGVLILLWSTVPLTRKALNKDKALVPLILPLSVIRTACLCLGVAGGLIKLRVMK
ncbi:MAG: glycosyltransferase [Firmicutes bacterium]|nr:glycosyltransferase [Bacillota bacterium]